jgi:hypothetical protein
VTTQKELDKLVTKEVFYYWKDEDGKPCELLETMPYPVSSVRDLDAHHKFSSPEHAMSILKIMRRGWYKHKLFLMEAEIHEVVYLETKK